jgi:hypothetical protein
VRQLISIFLLSIHLFAIGGYRYVIDAMEENANKELTLRLDQEDYNTADLIEIKIPLATTYPSNWSGEERYDGEIEFNNQHYRYVKRKLVNDSLVFYCIPNHGKLQLNAARDQFFSLVNDINQEENQPAPISKSALVKSITTEYPSTFFYFNPPFPRVICSSLGYHPNEKQIEIASAAPFIPPKLG